MTTKAKKTTKIDTFENAVNILNLAINRNISVQAASIQSKRGKNYVSDIKLTLDQRVERGSFSRKQAREFTSLYNKYRKLRTA